MIELDITRFFENEDASHHSASPAELGDNAGQITWDNACDTATRYADLLDTEEKREEARKHFAAYGAWSDEEITAWSDEELTAIVLQEISAEIRDFEELAKGDWEEWQRLCDEGVCNGLIFGGPLSTDGQVYFMLGG